MALNVAVLVSAKEEYTNQLKHYLCPLIQEGFTSIYEDAVINDSENNPLRQFQIFLKEIPKWNQTILEQETKRIKDKCEFLMDLVTAIFVSHVKILASVRLGGHHSNIKIKIPTSEIFIHSIYIMGAERFYYNPLPFQDLIKRENIEKIKETIEEVIVETISAMIPIQSILQEYLCNTFTDHAKLPPEPQPPGPLPSDREFNGLDIMDEDPVDNRSISSMENRENNREDIKTVNLYGDNDDGDDDGDDDGGGPVFPIGNNTPYHNNFEPNPEPPTEEEHFEPTPVENVGDPIEEPIEPTTPVENVEKDFNFFDTPSDAPVETSFQENNNNFDGDEMPLMETNTDDTFAFLKPVDDNDGGGDNYNFFDDNGNTDILS